MYSVVSGDTYEIIARKKYGDDKESPRIRRANPGIIEPLIIGTVLNIPDLNDSDKKNTSIPTTGEDIALIIDGERFRFWESASVALSMDAMSTVNFTAPFEPDNTIFTDIFKPLSFKKIQVNDGGDFLFSGRMLDVVPEIQPNRNTVSVSAYSLPAILYESCPSVESYPIEFNNHKLSKITNALIEPFGISSVFGGDEGNKFERVKCSPSRKIIDFLAELARLRNGVFSDTPEGELLFQNSANPGKPVASLRAGEQPVVSVTPNIKANEYYSHITGLEPASTYSDGSKFTVKNDRLTDILKPFVFTLSNAIKGGVKTAVNAKIGRMFANVVNYTLEVNTWRDPQGERWKPNTTIKLEAPRVMIYSSYEFLIRSVTLIRQKDNEKAILSLVLPGVFNGEIPETLPWD